MRTGQILFDEFVADPAILRDIKRIADLLGPAVVSHNAREKSPVRSVAAVGLRERARQGDLDSCRRFIIHQLVGDSSETDGPCRMRA